MAVFHVFAAYISKGKTQGGAGGLARYLAREQPEQALQFRRYLTREGREGEDLVREGAAALPVWASEARHFWAMADLYERQNGVVARCYQVTLPRELSPEGRLALADDIRATFFARYPHSWAVHNPPAHDGSGEQPHLHVMFSPRRDDGGWERTAEQWFRQAAKRGQDPAQGGARKDPVWDHKQTLLQVRAGCAVLINAALEREGVEAAVSHRSLREQGHDREIVRYAKLSRADQVEQARAYHAQLHRDYHPYEQETAQAAWYDQRQREGIRDLSREAIVDHVRDHFWLHDQSPAREAERQMSLLRTIDRAYAQTGRVREAVEVWGREPERKEPDVGYRRVANDHYGVGIGEARRAEERAQVAAWARRLAESRRLGRGIAGGLEDTPHGGVRWHERENERDLSYDR